MTSTKYADIIVEIRDKVGIIRLNRPKSLNAFGGKLSEETINAIRELDEHPDTIFTVLTGEGRFFCAGADVRAAGLENSPKFANLAEKKLYYMKTFLPGLEMVRSIIDHRKVFVLALNGPAVGAGAAWFPGVSDIVFASTSCYLQIPFSALGLVPENGSAITFSQSMGIHRTNEFMMFGRKLTAKELEEFGIVNQIFDNVGFLDSVVGYLKEKTDTMDGKSMIEAKRLMNLPLREGRIAAIHNAFDALAERFVEDAPIKRFNEKKKLMEAKSKGRNSKI